MAEMTQTSQASPAYWVERPIIPNRWIFADQDRDAEVATVLHRWKFDVPVNETDTGAIWRLAMMNTCNRQHGTRSLCLQCSPEQNRLIGDILLWYIRLGQGSGKLTVTAQDGELLHVTTLMHVARAMHQTLQKSK